MSDQPSNIATYCTEDGRPVEFTFFMSADLGAGLELYAYRSHEEREEALSDGKRHGLNCEALKHHAAFQLACGGLPMWINEGGADFSPLYFNRRNGAGWKPVVIEGGKPALAVALER